jgi:mannose-6-phosphate isomerase
MEPLAFHPLYQTRIWGGRSLETDYHRELPDDQPYGESWEITDRENEQSLVKAGPYAGKSLHDLWSTHRDELFGENLDGERFPLLIKILDARDDLSIQVHPPTEVAPALGGEPKTEMWYIADCDPGAKLHLGLRHGATRSDFEEALQEGSVADLVHSVEPRPHQSIFIPSGRLHAIGAGFLIYEIQQNSDTTYRVFDWNRMGLDGKPRDLHLEQSLASIDFEDFEPGMDEPEGHTLASCEHFIVERLEITPGTPVTNPDDRFSIITVISGQLTSAEGTSFAKGDFFILPRQAHPLTSAEGATILQTRLP